VVDELFARDPGLRVAVRGRAPAFLFPDRPGLERSEVEVDFGVRQADGFAIDHRATIAALRALAAGFDDRVRAEVGWLRSVGAAVVLGDVPALAFAAAALAGLPSLALANFSWDWVYRELARERREYEPFAALAAEAYGAAGVCLRLPLHGEMSAFREVVDVPFVVRRATATRDEAKCVLGLSPERPAVLLSFGGFAVPAAAQERLAKATELDFVVTDPPTHPVRGIRAVSARRDFETLLRAVDAVVTKPGWGVFAGCLVNGTRVLYAERDEFPEAEILVAAIEREGTAMRVAERKVLRGNIVDELYELVARPVTPLAVRSDGAVEVADRVLRALAARS
jgi:hypothetical protein